ncbi:MAG TPA: glycosyltransferase family 2 protein [Acidisoma sp.]|jgi:glycosyltransferase involved in cell wall biosynthesis|nr:glycosyltransferase family 2 protein [Acidisoma sp.]
MDRASTGLVLIPSYDTGTKLAGTVRDAMGQWQPVFLVIDGSTDGSADHVTPRSGLRVIRRPANGGKGAAVLDGLRAAAAEGFTHALVMDADGQHPAEAIPEFMALSAAHPKAMILGVPLFDATAPRARVLGRRISNVIVRWLTGAKIDDALFGFRVYPLAPLRAIMEASPHMRRYDFDAEAVVRLSWAGVPAINRPVPVHYFRSEEGGVSHFRYGRDNLLLARMYARLAVARLVRSLRPSHR